MVASPFRPLTTWRPFGNETALGGRLELVVGFRAFRHLPERPHFLCRRTGQRGRAHKLVRELGRQALAGNCWMTNQSSRGDLPPLMFVC